MDFGIALASSVDSWRTVQRAEELGFKDAWFYDSQLLYTDVFVSMALAAEKTSISPAPLWRKCLVDSAIQSMRTQCGKWAANIPIA